MKVSALLNTKGNDVFSISPDYTTRQTLQFFAEKRVGCALVVDAESARLGLITERDICHAISHLGGDAIDKPISDLTLGEIINCTPDDLLTTVMSLMTEHRTRYVIVMDDTDVAGIISHGDIVKQRLAEALVYEKSINDALEEYIRNRI